MIRIIPRAIPKQMSATLDVASIDASEVLNITKVNDSFARARVGQIDERPSIIVQINFLLLISTASMMLSRAKISIAISCFDNSAQSGPY
jgi:hypothetical protein